MLLVIDIGNTNTGLGVYKGNDLVEHWRLETDKKRTADEYGIIITNLLATKGIQPARIHGCIMCSVVPVLTTVFEEMARRYLHRPIINVGPGLKTGMPILTDNPREVGADRIVNAVAAYETYRCGCIIVDFGTATTFDCVSPRGEYLGGAIAPGFHISAEALFRETSKLPRVEVTRPRRAIGKNTVASMQAGIYYGYISLVEETVRRIAAELTFVPKVISTGGIARLFEQDATVIEAVDELLTLRGLKILYERNRDG